MNIGQIIEAMRQLGFVRLVVDCYDVVFYRSLAEDAEAYMAYGYLAGSMQRNLMLEIVEAF